MAKRKQTFINIEEGIKKWDFNKLLDTDSEQVTDNGYFGAYTKVKINNKFNIVYCDDRDAIIKVKSKEWFDEIFYGQGHGTWDGDYRWNSDKPLVVRNGRKYNLIKVHSGDLACEKWFDCYDKTGWHYDKVTATNYLNAKIKGRPVKVLTSGCIVFLDEQEDTQAILQEVQSWTKQKIQAEWIDKGKPCQYRYGFGWKGAASRPLTTEDASAKLKNYDFGIGFYNLNWIVDRQTGRVTLLFNELSENDMW